MGSTEEDGSDRACWERDADAGVDGDGGGAVGCPPGVGAPNPSLAVLGCRPCAKSPFRYG